MKHIPVLARSVVNVFESSGLKGGTYVDLTLGLGGHATLVAEAYRPSRIVAFDRDKDMLDLGGSALRAKLATLGTNVELELVHANYSDFYRVVAQTEWPANAILMDLGVASPHFDDPTRGMSFRSDSPLDMRLDRRQNLTAATIVNSYPESELGRIFRDYGEERHWRAAARAIAGSRQTEIRTTWELVRLVEPVLDPRKGRIHPATKIFQALRIAVNDELGHLERALPGVIQKLLSGGKLGVISFHSLEDRIVKQTFAKALENGTASSITKNPVEAKKEEIGENPRSRSAKLRVLTKA